MTARVGMPVGREASVHLSGAVAIVAVSLLAFRCVVDQPDRPDRDEPGTVETDVSGPGIEPPETEEPTPCERLPVPCDARGLPPNILVIIEDDVGLDMVGAYGASPSAPPTPTFDRLADEGVLFTHVWASAWCSPTRAGILTGVRPERLGFGRALRLTFEGEVSLPESTVTLPELLDAHSPWRWDKAFVGKWHLTTVQDDAVGAPLVHGFDHFTGTLGNLSDLHATDGLPQDYRDWEHVQEGVVRRRTDYITTATAEDAITVVRGLQAPWFTWVAFNAAHQPWDPAPAELHGYADVARAGIPTRYRAIVQAMDTEVGRFLAGIEPEVLERTILVVLSDNGTSAAAQLGGFEGTGGKSTVYETGVRVPLVISGPGIAQGVRFAGLTESFDLFATIAELAGVPAQSLPDGLDARSLVPALLAPDRSDGRDVLQTRLFEPNGPGPYTRYERAIRDRTFKLVDRGVAAPELYRIAEDGYESADLLAQGVGALPADARAAYEVLSSRLEAQDY